MKTKMRLLENSVREVKSILVKDLSPSDKLKKAEKLLDEKEKDIKNENSKPTTKVIDPMEHVVVSVIISTIYDLDYQNTKLAKILGQK